MKKLRRLKQICNYNATIKRSHNSYRSHARTLANVAGARRGREAGATHSSYPPEILASRTPPYKKLLEKLQEVRRVLRPSRKLTLAEKILYSHLDSVENSLAAGGPGNGRGGSNKDNIRGNATLKLNPDRVAMQDASAQMTTLQFMTCGLPATAVPASIHCDHMIVGERGADVDLPASIKGNKEVFDFLESAAKKYGIEFWPPGAGIIHQSVLENYAAPGLMMLGTDSHTPNAGGLGAIAIGVGGADAVDALVGIPWEMKAPKIMGVRLEGELSGWASAKDVILHLNGLLTVRGGTGFIVEYIGPGVDTLCATGMSTITNMGAEVGATTSIFPFTHSHVPYLEATHRGPIAQMAQSIASSPDKGNLLRADSDVEYDDLITINMSNLEPHINGPFTPDLSTPLSKFSGAVENNNWPKSFDAALIGSCTNSSYHDMTRAEDIVRQASAAGLTPKSPVFISPGSEQIRATLERDDTLSTFESAGATVLSNACGPCIGQWRRPEMPKNAVSAILTSYNRNFPGRNDGNRNTMNFLASPEVVTAMSYAGTTDFNPVTDTIPTPSGEPFKFSAPTGIELPAEGFASGNPSLLPPSLSSTSSSSSTSASTSFSSSSETLAANSSAVPDPSVTIAIAPTSSRLALLEPFDPFPDPLPPLRVLMKVRGQCTTDTISAAGPWLKFKGHLPNISANTLITATNAATGEVGVAYDYREEAAPAPAPAPTPTPVSIPTLATRYRDAQIPWLLVGDSNFGEGSAREHASLQLRYLGCRVVLVRSFARIHENNLKKQGVLPLTFADADAESIKEKGYEMINGGDEVTLEGVHEVLRSGGARGEIVVVVRDASEASGAQEGEGEKKKKKTRRIRTRHTLSPDQCRYILAGSALNLQANASANASASASASATV